MALFEPALDYLLDFEDAPRAYNAVPDVGGYAIAGINSNSWPGPYHQISELPQAQRGPAVASFYYQNFWVPVQAQALTSQDIANRLLDQSVNGGQNSGVYLLQKAANQLGCALAQDGVMGPNTIATVNFVISSAPDGLLAAYRAARVANYKAIVASHPERSRYLAQWLNRAQA